MIETTSLGGYLIWAAILIVASIAFFLGWRRWGVGNGLLVGVAGGVGAAYLSESALALSGYLLAGVVGWVVFVLIDESVG